MKDLNKILIIFLLGFLVGFSLNNNENSGFNLNKNLIINVNLLQGGESHKYSKNFDRNFHRILKKGFPDCENRVKFEQSQIEFYNSARLKLNKASGFFMKNKADLLTAQELDAINYFQGKGFYRLQQNFKTKFNVFDSRESLLIKMHDESHRNSFLKSLNH